MAISILDALSGNFPSEQDYLANSGWFNAGKALGQMQLPAPRTSIEALLGPSLQGLAAGSLIGYGRQQATDQAFKDYAASPLLNPQAGGMVGPLSQADSVYAGSEAPEGWTSKTGRSDLLQRALMLQANQEMEQEKAKQMLKYSPEALAGEAQLQAIKDGAQPIPGVPKGLQDSALKEVQTLADKKNVSDFIGKQFDAAKDISSLTAAVPGTTAANDMDGIAGALRTVIQKQLGREMNGPEQEKLMKMLPDWNDSTTQIEAKKARFMEMVNSITAATPVLSSLGAQAPGAAPAPPAGYELTGKVDASGNYGIRKIK